MCGKSGYTSDEQTPIKKSGQAVQTWTDDAIFNEIESLVPTINLSLLWSFL